MGIIVNQNDQERTALRDRVSAELREKSMRTQKIENADLVDDSKYIDGLKETGRFSWIWLVAILIAAILLVVILFVK